jgi:hypothetical protein
LKHFSHFKKKVNKYTQEEVDDYAKFLIVLRSIIIFI